MLMRYMASFQTSFLKILYSDFSNGFHLFILPQMMYKYSAFPISMPIFVCVRARIYLLYASSALSSYLILDTLAISLL